MHETTSRGWDRQTPWSQACPYRQAEQAREHDEDIHYDRPNSSNHLFSQSPSFLLPLSLLHRIQSLDIMHCDDPPMTKISGIFLVALFENDQGSSRL